mgnify:FL=1
MHLDKIRNSKDQAVPLHAVPKPAVGNYRPQKAAQSMSYSHNQFPNHFGQTDIQEQFEPTYVKLDKQVCSFSIPSPAFQVVTDDCVVYYTLNDRHQSHSGADIHFRQLHSCLRLACCVEGWHR